METNSFATKKVRGSHLFKRANSIKSLATAVMARMRDDDKKLQSHIKKFIKEHRSNAVKVLTSEIGGWTPIHACALKGSKKLFRVFLTSGVDVNVRMGQPDGLPNGCSLLHIVCLRGDTELIDLLLSNGADIEAVDSLNRTPLAYAANRKHVHAIRLLQEKGDKTSIAENPIWNDCETPKTSAKFCFF